MDRLNKKLLLVNIGCGPIFHTDWINLDILKIPGVIHHDIRNKLPFKENSIDVIYHSHLLEHLEETDGYKFILDCYRVLKPNGIIRIAVPDLEKICSEYLRNLNEAFEDKRYSSIQNYEWNKLEMFDQLIRIKSGGKIIDAIKDKKVNAKYATNRCGDEVASFFDEPIKVRNSSIIKKIKDFYKKLFPKKYNPQRNGEAHKYMYDRLSLYLLVEKVGFKNFIIQQYNTSQIDNWSEYNLDRSSDKQGPRKPDSIFIEAKK